MLPLINWSLDSECHELSNQFDECAFTVLWLKVNYYKAVKSYDT